MHCGSSCLNERDKEKAIWTRGHTRIQTQRHACRDREVERGTEREKRSDRMRRETQTDRDRGKDRQIWRKIRRERKRERKKKRHRQYHYIFFIMTKLPGHAGLYCSLYAVLLMGMVMFLPHVTIGALEPTIPLDQQD